MLSMEIAARKVLRLVSIRDRITASDLANELAISRTAVRHHLQVLERQGLLIQQKQGRQRLYFLAPESSLAEAYAARLDEILAEVSQLGRPVGAVLQKIAQKVSQKIAE